MYVIINNVELYFNTLPFEINIILVLDKLFVVYSHTDHFKRNIQNRLLSQLIRSVRWVFFGIFFMMVGARWPSGLDRLTGDRVVMGSDLADAYSLRKFGNSIYPTLSMSFGGYTKNRRSLQSGVYARGSILSYTGDTCIHWRGISPLLLNPLLHDLCC